MLIPRLLRTLLCLGITPLSLLLPRTTHSTEATVDYDTTRVREVQPVEKSMAEKAADIPGEILKLPVYTFELVAHTLVMNPPISWIHYQKRETRIIPVAGYSTRAGLKLGLGVKLLGNDRLGHRLKLKSYYSTHNYQSYRLRFTSPRLFSPRVGFKASIQYKKKTRQSFYGIGAGSSEDQEVNVGWENTAIQAWVPVQVTRSGKITVHAQTEITNLFDGRDSASEGRLQVIRRDPELGAGPGQLDPMRHLDFGVLAELDGRDSVSRPTHGSHLLGSYERLFGTGRSAGRDFEQMTIDYRHFVHLWKKRSLAFRTLATRMNSIGTGREGIPYYLASRLGGVDVLRGYTSGRFTDNDAAYASVEYRYPVYDHVDAFLFLDEGRVYQNILRDVVLENWQHSFGFGFRVWDHESVLAVAQVARSSESTRAYFELGATW